jgi:hypothetical protein
VDISWAVYRTGGLSCRRHGGDIYIPITQMPSRCTS